MIEMNKKKTEEVNGLLKGLEREISTEIDSLANKTAIKEYHETDFSQLLEVLKKNRNKVSIARRSRAMGFQKWGVSACPTNLRRKRYG